MSAQDTPGGDGSSGITTSTATVESPSQPAVESHDESHEEEKDECEEECKEFAEPGSSDAKSFRPGLVATTPLMPLSIAVGAALLYTTFGVKWLALLGGIAGLALMFVWAALLRSSVGARTASPRSYGALYDELLMVDSRLGICKHDAVEAHPSVHIADCPEADVAALRTMAHGEAVMYRNAFVKTLQSPAKDARWIRGVGYVELWNHIHHAEEALILFEPDELVIGDARHDLLRLKGALIDQGPDLAKMIDDAVKALDPDSNQNPPPKALSETDKMNLRGRLREARAAINGFRDDSRDGIVRARGHLLETVLALGILTCILVALAILLGINRVEFTGAFWVYLIGAAVGLFNRLYLDSRADTQVDDFGLANARLIAMPLFSGLAAVGGVLLTSLISNAALLTHAAPIPLGQGFDLQVYPGNIAVAAVFGLTPALLVNSLQQQGANYLSNIKSSNATTPISR